MISLEEVKHIADLARIDFSTQELKQLQKELSLILGYIDKLKEIDVKEIEPTSHSVLVKNVLRKDEAGPPATLRVAMRAGQGSEQNSKSLVDLAPNKDKSFIKVKSVFKK